MSRRGLQSVGRRVVSLGGWCGPALILSKLGLRRQAFPFDFSRCTLDGIIHFFRHGFDGTGFFPPGGPPYVPECVGPYVLFRGVHTAFAHFDLNSADVQEGFLRKFERLHRVLDNTQNQEEVLFIRSVTARDPQEELALAPELEKVLEQRSPRLSFRIAFLVHDQGLAASPVELMALSPRMRVWTLEYEQDASHSLLDRVENGYTSVLREALKDDGWEREVTGEAPPPPPPVVAAAPCSGMDHLRRLWLPRLPLRAEGVPHEDLTAHAFPWRSHNNLALIDGVASVGGTCVGVGSTLLRRPRGCEHLAPQVCAYCGNTDYHAAGRPYSQVHKAFTSREDALLLAHLCKVVVEGVDRIAVVDQLAQELHRSAVEIVDRLRTLSVRHPQLGGGGGGGGAPFSIE